MLPHQERVVEEKKQLDEKLDKLTEFLKTDTFKNLNEYERERLERQHEYMTGYSDVLAERIVHFKW